MTATAIRYIPLDETLRQLRAELRREFPGVKFSVTRSRGTAYGWVRVSWTDGPTERDVQRVTSGYEGAGFDGMTDSSYTITHTIADEDGNPVEVRHGTRGINTSRAISAALANALIQQVADYWGGVENVPVAVEGACGYRLEPATAWRSAVRADLSLDWGTAIHRAAGGEYVRD